MPRSGRNLQRIYTSYEHTGKKEKKTLDRNINFGPQTGIASLKPGVLEYVTAAPNKVVEANPAASNSLLSNFEPPPIPDYKKIEGKRPRKGRGKTQGKRKRKGKKKGKGKGGKGKENGEGKGKEKGKDKKKEKIRKIGELKYYLTSIF